MTTTTTTAVTTSSVAAVACTAVAAVSFYYLHLRPKAERRRFEQILAEHSDFSDLLLKETSKEDDSSCVIYLDYNGTTPIHPSVLCSMLPYLTTHFGNPSSSHYFGQAPKKAIEQARRSILKLLGASPRTEPLSTVWFTSCGTESDNLAIELALISTPKIPKKHIVTTNVEHPAIDSCLRTIQARSPAVVQVTFVPVQKDGRVLAEDVIAAIHPNTVLVTIMLANNESGALMPVRKVAEECRKRHVLCHTDAAQAVGKVNVSLQSLGYPDFITIVGHKIGAPKGVACLYVRKDCCNQHGRHLSSEGGILLLGGGQEFGRRGGTENVPYLAGMGKAAEICHKDWKTNAARMEVLRQRLLENLVDALGAETVRANGPTEAAHRLPNTLSVGLKNIHSGKLLAAISNQVAASAGAACHSTGSSGDGISSVLRAMQVPPEFAAGTLRLSLGPTTTEQEVDRAATVIVREAKRQLAITK